MNTKQKVSTPTPPPAAITMRDIYYVLFRHKWLIGILAGVGILASAGVYFLYPFSYYSHAKVFIRYIQDARPPGDIDSSAKVQSPDIRGANIMNTELEILTSADLAMYVVTNSSFNLGPERILGKGNSNNFAGAAGFIEANLKAEVPKDSDVILLQFKANNSGLAQEVLSRLIEAYKQKYVEIHLAPGFSTELLDRETGDSKKNLTNAMQTLEDVKKELGITSLDDAKKYAAELHAKTLDSIYDVEAQIAQNAAIITNLQARIPGATTNESGTNQSLNAALAAPPPGPEVLDGYKDLIANRTASHTHEQLLLTQFTTNNILVQNAQGERERADAKVEKYEKDNPGLLAVKQSDLGRLGLSPATVDPVEAWRAATDKYRELTARLDQLKKQETNVVEAAGKLDAAEDRITQAETDLKVEDAKYEHLRLATEQASINVLLGSSVSNIGTAEAPTAGGPDLKQVLKVTMGILGFFLALAFGLPFFIEMVLDQSLKNPMDVQARIGMPFFVNIPRINGNGHAKLKLGKRAKEVPLLNGQNGAAPDSAVPEQNGLAVRNGNGSQMALWDGSNELKPYFETLRDRLMTYFEMINLTHKPKLVAVTSCGPNAGVTTTAAGLASSLSEIGEGNVLLVSMNERDGEAHHFYKGKLTCGIEAVLEKKNREQAQVQNNLFVAEELESGDQRLPRVLPKRFSHLVPMMKASDYDYIIFDMPPVSEISITPRLARFMDMVLLVIESEKTSRDAAARVTSMLTESKTNVGLVLNKNRSYMPKRLEQTF